MTASIVNKAVVGFVAAAMVFTMFAPAAQAQSTEDLQKMIDDLMKQVAALQGQGGTSSSPASGICPFTWTRDLKTGAMGADVMKLQQFLNADEATRVAASGAGSVGMETEFYGPATAAAVSKMQVKFRADILTPAGLVNPTGFFGPSSRAKANSLCVASTGGDEDEDEDGDMTDEDEDTELQGEGSLDKFEADDASDTDIQEGAEDEVIAEITAEAIDGDLELDRITFEINDGTVANTEKDPWDVFDELSLWVDGEKVATFDASDEDSYLDEDSGEFRFSSLGLVLPEDEEVEILVGATVAGNVDGADGAANVRDWVISATEVRYFDADGVSDDDATTDELPTATANFEIVEQGDGEELKFSLGDGNPESTDIIVDTSDKTNDVTVMEYTLEAKDGDIDVNSLFVKLTTSTTSSLVIDDVTLDIGGETFDAENSATTTANDTTFEFDIDGDVTIDDGDEVTVKVMVDFRAQESSTNVARYLNGTTVKAEVTSVERGLTDAEGADDLGTSDFTGSAVGDQHTLVAEGIVVPVDGFDGETFTTQGQNDTTGIFTLTFEVKAVENDFYVRKFATLGTATSTGVEYTLNTPAGYSAGSSTVSASLTSTADEDTTGVFTVDEGTTETFTLKVTVDPNVTGLYSVLLNTVNYTDDAGGVTGTKAYAPTPAQDFDTEDENINAS
jgi:hypothetical protein